jgi:hypothetical protein
VHAIDDTTVVLGSLRLADEAAHPLRDRGAPRGGDPPRPGRVRLRARWLAELALRSRRAVDAIRDDPGAPWSFDGLARLAHTSRSAFAERFRAAAVDGEPRSM